MNTIGFFVLALAVSMAVVFGIKGEFSSCSGCKLNRLPEVRRFFKEPGHADSYENVLLNFQHGRNPDFIIRDDSGAEMERFDLSDLSTEQIHELVQSKGFVRKVEEDVENNDEL